MEVVSSAAVPNAVTRWGTVRENVGYPTFSIKTMPPAVGTIAVPVVHAARKVGAVAVDRMKLIHECHRALLSGNGLFGQRSGCRHTGKSLACTAAVPSAAAAMLCAGAVCGRALRLLCRRASLRVV